jgi:diguanylate cyclase (GGDEF)-like protein/PAS domain S-box-containing protein
MTKQLRVLVLESDPTWVELELQELREAGYDPLCQRVDTSAGFLAALDPSLDLILAENSLPDFDALAALAQLRGRAMDVPCILVSAALDDETALAAMKHRAWDFVRKDRPAHLALTVARALQDRELRREHERVTAAWQETEDSLRLALSAAHLATFEWDVAEDQIVWSRWNGAPWGFAPSGQFTDDVEVATNRVFLDDLPDLNAKLARCRSLGGNFDHEFRVVWPDGSIHWLHASGRMKDSRHNQGQRLCGAAIEITERKRVEAVSAAREEQLRAIFNTEPECVALFAADGSILEMNAAGLILVEADSFQQVRDLGVQALVVPDDAASVRHLSERVFRGESGTLEFRIIGFKGSKRILDIHAAPLRDADGSIMALLGVARDVTERREQERKISRLNRIRAVIGGISSVMLHARDRAQLLEEACRVAVEDGIFPAAWITLLNGSASAGQIVALHAPDQEAFAPILRALIADPERPGMQVISSGKRIVCNDLANLPSNRALALTMVEAGYHSAVAFPLSVGSIFIGSLSLLARDRDFFDDEEVALLEWLTSDLSYALEAIDTSAKLQHLAYFDALTGVANARLFQDRLGLLLETARQSDSKVCLVVMDLVEFTQINDTLGRAAGDEVLRQIAFRLNASITEPFCLGRIGADTFALASPGDNNSVLTALREQVQLALERPLMIDGQAVPVAVQAGIAIFPDDGIDASSVFKNAEAALQRAKSSGVPYRYFSHEIHARITEQRILTEELRAAIQQQQLELRYQPRVDMISGELIGAEARVLWRHPARGLLASTEFMDVARQSGLIIAIDAWSLQNVCAQQANWRAAGLHSVPIAVNLTASQFVSGELARAVINALTAHSLDANLLELELTESEVMGNPDAATEIFQVLHNLGVGLTLGKFGVGDSSLTHLKRLAIDAIKIDGNFVSEITSNTQDAAITKAIIAMAHSLGLKVLAGDIETKGQFNYLRTCGCDRAQGAMVGAEVAAVDFEINLRSIRRLTMPIPTRQHTLLLVDDEPAIRSALTRMLRPDGYHVLSASSGAEALEMLAENPVQVIISDQRMPGMTGTEFLNIAKQLYPETVRIILSGYTDLATVTESINRGSVYKFLTKPWEDEVLRQQVRDAFQCYRGPGG